MAPIATSRSFSSRNASVRFSSAAWTSARFAAAACFASCLLPSDEPRSTASEHSVRSSAVRWSCSAASLALRTRGRSATSRRSTSLILRASLALVYASRSSSAVSCCPASRKRWAKWRA
eukprot:scaffold11601_cov31-Tisochrysis_lutea.AAC.4